MECETSNINPRRKIITVGVVSSYRPEFLKGMLKALLPQLTSHREVVEVVLVIDGYDEDTLQIIQQFQNNDVCIRYVVNQKNQGRPRSRNRVVSEARGTYILWIDDDDVPFPDLISSHLHVLEDDPSIDVAYIDLEVYDIATKTVTGILSAPDVSALGSMLYERLFFGYGLPSIGSIIRRSLYHEVGGFDEQFIRAQDAEFWFRIVHKARFHKIDKVLYRYNQHSGSISAERKDDYSFISLAILKTLQRVPIDEILPHLSWQDPSRALAQACLFLARAFKHNGDYYNCYRFISLVSLEYLAIEDLRLLMQSAFVIGAGRAVKGKIESLEYANKMFTPEMISELFLLYTTLLKLEDRSREFLDAGISSHFYDLENAFKQYARVDPLCILEVKALDNARQGHRVKSRKMYEACLRYAPEDERIFKKCRSLGDSEEENEEVTYMKERVLGSRGDQPLYFISQCQMSAVGY
jgi:glycosyltransferase involved in cell wall biosynthesis